MSSSKSTSKKCGTVRAEKAFFLNALKTTIKSEIVGVSLKFKCLVILSFKWKQQKVLKNKHASQKVELKIVQTEAQT